MIRSLLALALFTGSVAYAQQEGPVATQALVAFESKTAVAPTAANLTFKVESRRAQLASLAAIPPDDVQVALLMDDGLRLSVGREMNALRAFLTGLPAGTEVFVGYMQNGRVVPAAKFSTFTSDRAAAAQTLRIPSGIPGSSASPYFCLSDFVKNWPGNAEDQVAPSQSLQSAPRHKARFVLMISNGVDPYNGSTSITNQDSPYVAASVSDAQRAGVPVYSIYFSDAGFRRRGGSFSGQSYLNQLAEGTGGIAFYQGIGNPVSMDPYLQQFQRALSETFVATFPIDSKNKLVRLQVETNLPRTKVRAPQAVRPGTVVLGQ
ncbi:MAG: hypothetical protein M3Y50_07095 [Acidobacteriota bacterium]|nr:hypothetical protein [Acidobacteriota bacterium]